MPVVCPVCTKDAEINRSLCSGDHHWIECPQCGTYEIGGLDFETLNPSKEPMAELSSALRWASDGGEKLPMLTKWTIQEILDRHANNR